MSRSYRKYPVLYYEGKEDKHRMNRAFRRTMKHNYEKLPKGNGYRKTQPHYLWHPVRWSKEKAVHEYNSNEYPFILSEFDSLEDYIRYWEKCVKRK